MNLGSPEEIHVTSTYWDTMDVKPKIPFGGMDSAKWTYFIIPPSKTIDRKITWFFTFLKQKEFYYHIRLVSEEGFMTNIF